MYFDRDLAERSSAVVNQGSLRQGNPNLNRAWLPRRSRAIERWTRRFMGFRHNRVAARLRTEGVLTCSICVRGDPSACPVATEMICTWHEVWLHLSKKWRHSDSWFTYRRAKLLRHSVTNDTVIGEFIHSQALIVQDGPLASLCGVSWSHTYRHTVGLLWTGDQPVAETSTYTVQHNI
jgi:hypothetical protein